MLLESSDVRLRVDRMLLESSDVRLVDGGMLRLSSVRKCGEAKLLAMFCIVVESSSSTIVSDDSLTVSSTRMSFVGSSVELFAWFSDCASFAVEDCSVVVSAVVDGGGGGSASTVV